MLRAGFGIRLAAAAIDLAVMYLLYSAVSMIGGVYLFASRGPRAPSAAHFLVWMMAAGAATAFLCTTTELLGAASPAKRLLKLRIAAADGAPAAFARRAVRWALKYGPMLIYLAATAAMFGWATSPGGPTGSPPMWLIAINVACLLAILAVVGGFFATLSSRRQGLHDLIAGTVILRAQQPQGFTPVIPAAPLTAWDGGDDGR